MTKIKPAIYFVRVIGESKPGTWTQRTGERFTLLEYATTSWNAAEQFASQHLRASSAYTIEVYACSDKIKVERFNVRSHATWEASPC